MNKILFAALASATLAFTSCADDFLDRQPQGSYVDNEQTASAKDWNPQVLLGNINACSSKLVMWAGGDDQSHFGQKFLDMCGDIMTGDIVKASNSYGWFTPAFVRTNSVISSDDNDYTWKYCYQLIKSANQVFDDSGSDVEEPESAENKFYWAVAKTIRAYAYMNLINFYSGSYDEWKETRCVPVYRTQINQTPAPKQTVDSVYNLVKMDLTQAITAYENSGLRTSDLTMPTINVARTLLAYAYLNTGKYAQAADMAALAFNSDSHQILPVNQVLTTGFNSVSNNANNWMWGIDVTAETTGGLATFWGHMDPYTYSYASVGDFMCINDTLFKTIPQNDIRRQWFVGDEEFQYFAGMFGNANALAASNKFFDSKRSWQGDALWTNDVVYMRAEEPVLIAAEAYTRNGDLNNGRVWLRKLLEQRDAEGVNGTLADTVNTMSTAEKLLDAIYFNWRVEMWGEGRSLMTMRRFKATNAIGSNTYILAERGTNISYNDKSIIFVIPQSEINSNKNLDKVEN